MGYPASAALLFKALTEEKDQWLHREAIAIVEKFSLFAIILADPVKDPVFYRHLQENFPFYDRLTGKSFLFFSIVKEQDFDSFEGAHKRYKVFNDTEAYRQNHAAEEVKNSELVIHALCTLLGIDYDDTPCILVSNQFRFGQFCKINTGINILEKQLKELSRVADYLSTSRWQRSLAELLLEFNKLGNFINVLEELQINTSKIKLISEILQAVSSEGMFADITIQTLKKKLYANVLTQKNDITHEQVIETLSLLGMANKRSRRIGIMEKIIFQAEDNLPNNVFRDWVKIEQTTKNYIKAALFISENMDSFLSDNEDYSIYTFPLCKAFEIEINLSVVQLIRRELGVSMPVFFSKHCPEKNDLPFMPSSNVINNPRTIYLNKKAKGKWLPPGLGESRLVFETLRMSNPDLATNWQPKEKLKILQTNWSAIQKIRNLTTHTESVSRKYKKALDESFHQLVQNNLLNALTMLKSALRN